MTRRSSDPKLEFGIRDGETAGRTMDGASLRAFQNASPTIHLDVEGAVWSLRDTDPGSGRIPIVMLPGAGGTGDVFYHVIEEIRTLRRVVSVSYPALSDVKDVRSGLAAALSNFGITQVDICGSSLGGYISQAFAIEWPERVRLCMLCNTFFDASWLRSKISRDSLFDTPAEEHLANAIRKLHELGEETAEQIDFKRTLLSLVGNDQTADMAKSALLAVLGAPTLDRIPLTPKAVAILDTRDDTVVDDPTRMSVRKRYHDSVQYLLKTGGHYPALLNPTEFTRAVLAHFASE